MDVKTVRDLAFATPLVRPAYPMGPYRFIQREFFVISYRTDPNLLRAVVPEPLEIAEPLVHYEFIRMPDSTGFGNYSESGMKLRGKSAVVTGAASGIGKGIMTAIGSAIERVEALRPLPRVEGKAAASQGRCASEEIDRCVKSVSRCRVA
jgi:hypothetical protein